MGSMRIGSSAGIQGAAAIAVLLFIAALAAPTAFAAEGERKLDPRLSLIGACKEETLDPVEDPGCPTTPPVGNHPPSPFSDPRAVATDSYGNIYVSSFGSNSSGSQGRIDIFDPDGVFISELKVTGPTSLAIDSDGNLYVVAQIGGEKPILRFAPDASYDPGAGDIKYSSPPASLVLAGPGCTAFECAFRGSSSYTALAINPEDDHLFANFGGAGIAEFNSAEEGNEEVRTTPSESWPGGAGLAVDDARDRLYASVKEERIDIFDLTSIEGSPPNDKYQKIGTIDGSETPAGDFGTQLSVAVDEGTGHVFVFESENTHLYEFDEKHKFLREVDFDFQKVEAGQIAVDNGPFSPNGALSKKGRYLYVPSHRTGVGHSFAFFESKGAPPVVKSAEAANISEDEAELRAQVNPGNLDTAYAFEIKPEGSATWILAGKGTLPADNLDTEASAVAAGLESGTRYLFRIVATNEEGFDEMQGSFATYPSVVAEPVPCANALVRTGPSALLPDCRAYELVTPPDTNGRVPFGTGILGHIFTNRQVSPAGDKVPFAVEGGSIPGLGGTGSSNDKGDPYLSSRTPSGWATTYIGPTGAEATTILAGTASPDQGHSFWTAEGGGSAVLGGSTSYVRYPDGHSEVLGNGSIGTDREAFGLLISEGGGHIIFATGAGASPDTAVQLEPEAAPPTMVEVENEKGEMEVVEKGTRAIYDRTADGILHVVSLKPGDLPFDAGEHANFQGASLDGEGVAFEVGSTLYLRYDNVETYVIGTGVDFAGAAEGGGRVFYMEGGDLQAFDVTEGVIEFTDAGDAVPVQVSLDGTAAYFVSQTAIAGSGPNPEGDEPQAGEQNLYLSEEGEISFVATVTDRDVEGKAEVDGLGLWMTAISPPSPGRLGIVPARTTPDGKVLLFKSRAALGDYDPEGKAQIYRFDSVGGELQCLSCNPTGAAATSDADLQSEQHEGLALALFYPWAWLENLRADGRRAFFETKEPLVVRDVDGLRDVYEWEDQGVGSCTAPGGCTYLISSPQSLRAEYLWAVSESGDDVFFLSSELLVGRDADETPSIYDARVGGGFAEPVDEECKGEGCRPQIMPAPLLPGAEPHGAGVNGNVNPVRRCGKGKRKVKRAGKVRCVKKKKAGKRRAGNKQRGGRR
jgi:hypothetical protein